MQARVPWINSQEVIWGTTADYATNKDVTLHVLSPSHGFFDSRENLAPTQPLINDYVEVKCLKGLFQQIWMGKEGISTLDTEYLFSKSVGAKCLTCIVTHTVYDETNPFRVTGNAVGIQLILWGNKDLRSWKALITPIPDEWKHCNSNQNLTWQLWPLDTEIGALSVTAEKQNAIMSGPRL